MGWNEEWIVFAPLVFIWSSIFFQLFNICFIWAMNLSKSRAKSTSNWGFPCFSACRFMNDASNICFMSFLRTFWLLHRSMSYILCVTCFTDRVFTTWDILSASYPNIIIASSNNRCSFSIHWPILWTFGSKSLHFIHRLKSFSSTIEVFDF